MLVNRESDNDIFPRENIFPEKNTEKNRKKNLTPHSRFKNHALCRVHLHSFVQVQSALSPMSPRFEK